MSLAILYITCANENQAQKIAWHLISKKLIACANMFPISSIYSWKGKVMSSKEFVLIAKTAKSNFSAVKKEVKLVHSYEVPCVVMIDAQANEEYAAWVNEQLGITSIKQRVQSITKAIRKSVSSKKNLKKKASKRK